MDRFHTVKKNTDFFDIIHNGKFVKNSTYVLYFKENGMDIYRFGISVSKKLGKAVLRNKYKRQLRFIIDKYKKNYQIGLDYIIIMRNGYIGLNFADKEQEFKNLLDQIQQNNKEK